MCEISEAPGLFQRLLLHHQCQFGSYWSQLGHRRFDMRCHLLLYHLIGKICVQRRHFLFDRFFFRFQWSGVTRFHVVITCVGTESLFG